MNVDLANQADTSSFCPPGHTSRPTFSPARFLLISMPVPASWIPQRLAPPQTDLGSPTTIKGLVCQVLGQTWKGPQRSQQRQMEHPPIPPPHIHRRRSPTEGTLGGGGGVGDLHPECRFPPLNTLSKPSQDKTQDLKKESHKAIPFI